MTEILALVQHSLEGQALNQAQAEHFFSEVAKGQVDTVHLTALLVALKLRGETADEIAGAARAFRAQATPFHHQLTGVIDCCGTGGDGSNTINISSTAALVAASMGLPVAKHGNRSVSSRSGSADLLENLGINIHMSAEQACHVLAQTNLSFLFAPLYHSGIRHAMPVRNSLKSRTLFNLLGPLLNPAQPEFQLLGVYSPGLLRVMAQALLQLGVKSAWVVHGSGCDEIALHGPTLVCALTENGIEEFTLTPHDFGLETRPLTALAGGEPEQNAKATRAILQGEGELAHTQAVAMNVAAMLKISGQHGTLKELTDKVLTHIQSGKSLPTLEKLQELSHG